MSYEISVNSATSSPENIQVSLIGEVCVFHAAELKPRLAELLKPNITCTLDLSSVSEVDTAGIQLLLIAKREAENLGCQLSFVNHSGVLREVMELLNLSHDFGDPVPLVAGDQENPV